MKLHGWTWIILHWAHCFFLESLYLYILILDWGLWHCSVSCSFLINAYSKTFDIVNHLSFLWIFMGNNPLQGGNVKVLKLIFQLITFKLHLLLLADSASVKIKFIWYSSIFRKSKIFADWSAHSKSSTSLLLRLSLILNWRTRCQSTFNIKSWINPFQFFITKIIVMLL